MINSQTIDAMRGDRSVFGRAVTACTCVASTSCERSQSKSGKAVVRSAASSCSIHSACSRNCGGTGAFTGWGRIAASSTRRHVNSFVGCAPPTRTRRFKNEKTKEYRSLQEGKAHNGGVASSTRSAAFRRRGALHHALHLKAEQQLGHVGRRLVDAIQQHLHDDPRERRRIRRRGGVDVHVPVHRCLQLKRVVQCVRHAVAQPLVEGLAPAGGAADLDQLLHQRRLAGGHRRQQPNRLAHLAEGANQNTPEKRRGPQKGWSTGHEAPRWEAGRTGLSWPAWVGYHQNRDAERGR
eukprot:831070-Prorocentrum_minimum.AAC.2